MSITFELAMPMENEMSWLFYLWSAQLGSAQYNVICPGSIDHDLRPFD